MRILVTTITTIMSSTVLTVEAKKFVGDSGVQTLRSRRLLFWEGRRLALRCGLERDVGLRLRFAPSLNCGLHSSGVADRAGASGFNALCWKIL